MKIKIGYIYLILAILILVTNQVQAGSFYNSRGLGEIKYFTHAHAIGMGGSLIAVPDQFQINVLNPAGLVFIPLTRLSGDFLHEAIWNKSKLEDGFTKYTNFNGISFAIPLKVERLVTSISLIPSSQLDYEYAVKDSIDNYGFSKRITGSGGLNKISFGFGLAITKNIYLGNYLHVNFGKLEQNWKVDYISDLFWDSNNRQTSKYWGLSWTSGLIIHPIPSLYFGAIYSAKHKLNYNDEVDRFTQKASSFYLVENFKTENQKVNIPELWGMGMTCVFKEKYRLSSDFIYQSWSNFESVNDLSTDYNDRFQLSVGIEMLPSKNMLAKYYERMTYRTGYFYHQLDFQDQSGNSVIEYGFTVGFGFPYYSGWGRIDAALRYGQRGNLSSNMVKEDVFQIYISVTGGEKWFFRGN